jgi:hypothetical protein
MKKTTIALSMAGIVFAAVASFGQEEKLRIRIMKVDFKKISNRGNPHYFKPDLRILPSVRAKRGKEPLFILYCLYEDTKGQRGMQMLRGKRGSRPNHSGDDGGYAWYIMRPEDNYEAQVRKWKEYSGEGTEIDLKAFFPDMKSRLKVKGRRKRYIGQQKVLAHRLEVYFEGAILAEKTSLTRSRSPGDKLPDDWFHPNKYPDKYNYFQRSPE